MMKGGLKRLLRVQRSVSEEMENECTRMTQARPQASRWIPVKTNIGKYVWVQLSVWINVLTELSLQSSLGLQNHFE